MLYYIYFDIKDKDNEYGYIGAIEIWWKENEV